MNMCAALLANAGSGPAKLVRPKFMALLEMAPDEADLLSAVARLRSRPDVELGRKRSCASKG
jgi:hypothetical protein